MATVTINSEQITSIANSLKSKSGQIVSKYKEECTSAIQMSSECIKVSGLDFDQFFKALENIYTKVTDRINSLTDFLINNVVAEYESIGSAISNTFTNDLAQSLSGLIPGMGTASVAGSAISNASGQPATSAPETSAPTTSAPVTSAPVTSAPVTSAPITSAPVTSAPVVNSVVNAATPSVPDISGLGGINKPNVSGLTSGIVDFLNNNS